MPVQAKRDLGSEYRERGFAIVEKAISAQVIAELISEADRFFESSGSRGGARNLLQRSERFRRESEDGVPAEFATQILGPTARPTKLTLFNKTPAANWLIRWHQDLTITVRERRDTRGFSAWSLKDGVPHVRPPVQVLRHVMALRLHLDDTPAINGALKVLPGSHRFGRLTREAVQRYRQENREVICEVRQGGLMLMSPLLLHASSKAAVPQNRRVLHFEYSAEDLPGGLEWA